MNRDLEGALKSRYVLRIDAMGLRDEINARYAVRKRIDRRAFPAEELLFTCQHCGETVYKCLLSGVMYHNTTLYAPDHRTTEY